MKRKKKAPCVEEDPYKIHRKKIPNGNSSKIRINNQENILDNSTEQIADKAIDLIFNNVNILTNISENQCEERLRRECGVFGEFAAAAEEK